MGMVLLSSPKQPTADRLRAKIHELFRDAPVLGGGSDALKGTPFQSSTQVPVSQTVRFDVPGGLLVLGLVEAPIPAAELEWPLSTAYLWPEAPALVPAHRAHVIAMVLSHSVGKLESMCWLTQAMAAASELSEGLGAYWGAGGLVQSAACLLRDAREGSTESPSFQQWVAFHPVSEPAGWCGYSQGLEEFGHLDFEIRDAVGEPAEVLGRLAAAVRHVLTTGRKFADGDVFGVAADQRFPVKLTRSRYQGGRPVCLLESAT